MTDTRAPSIIVVGIGADGWSGLTAPAQNELLGATVVYGSPRQLSLLDPGVTAQRIVWETPLLGHLRRVLSEPSDQPIHVVASGDPMFHGIGSSIARLGGRERLRVIPTVSSASLACARMGWDLSTVRIVSAVTGDTQIVASALTDGASVLVLSRDATTPSEVAALLSTNGFGASTMTVLAQLGGPVEQSYSAQADQWVDPQVDALNIIALELRGPRWSAAPGLPDERYANDGQLTKDAIRAMTVAALAPTGVGTLWDVGSGSGSVAIEWLKAETGSRAILFEADATRAQRLRDNAATHGVAHRIEVRGAVPQAFAGAGRPDTIFIGGGLDDEVLDWTWSALRSGGRLVVNAVTIENQCLITEFSRCHGGRLRRFSVETAAPLGSMTTWRPALPIVQWTGDKP